MHLAKIAATRPLGIALRRSGGRQARGGAVGARSTSSASARRAWAATRPRSRVHVELAATHITMNPVAVNMQCHSARRAQRDDHARRHRILPDGRSMTHGASRLSNMPSAEAIRCARCKRRRHRHAGTARCSASATRRRSHMFDRGRTTRFDLQRPRGDPHRAQRAQGRRRAPSIPPATQPLCIGTTTSMRMERFTRPLMAQRRRAHHHRQGRHGRRHRSPPSRELGGAYLAIVGGAAALETTWIEADRGRRSRRPQSRSRCGNSASAISARCWWRWTATAARSTRGQRRQPRARAARRGRSAQHRTCDREAACNDASTPTS